jgi:hypothetical protein
VLRSQRQYAWSSGKMSAVPRGARNSLVMGSEHTVSDVNQAKPASPAPLRMGK